MSTAAVALSDWLAKLETISSREIDLSLERVVRVLERLALPIAARVFHIAGTNGKGSTVAMLESLLRHNGFRVGCYTSPHILRYNERIRIDGVEVADEEIIAAFEQIEALREDEALTYFEFGTLAALVVFAKAGVDTLVLEVGMGGRLDAVNAVEPTAGIITNIALDHCEWLGDNIAAIAVEKAGIMRRDKPVIFSAREIPPAIFDRPVRPARNCLWRAGILTGRSMAITGPGRELRTISKGLHARHWLVSTSWPMRLGYSR